MTLVVLCGAKSRDTTYEAVKRVVVVVFGDDVNCFFGFPRSLAFHRHNWTTCAINTC